MGGSVNKEPVDAFGIKQEPVEETSIARNHDITMKMVTLKKEEEEEDNDDEEEKEEEEEEDSDEDDEDEEEGEEEEEDSDEEEEDEDDPQPKRRKVEHNSDRTTSQLKQVQCQMCDEDGHRADQCPKVYTTCPHCQSIRVISISNTRKNPGRKFFVCQYPVAICRGPPFPWVDKYVEPSNSSSCPDCGTREHSKVERCTWKGIPCRDPENKGCTGERKLRKSSNPPLSKGKRFLVCDTCGHLQWLPDAIYEREVARNKSSINYWARVFSKTLRRGLNFLLN